MPRDELPQAITAIGIAYNGARALGPALAGVVYRAGRAGLGVRVRGAGRVAHVEAVRRHPPQPHPPSRLPAERLWGGMLSALRFARHIETVLAQLVRTVAYSGAGSALWALLPVVGPAATRAWGRWLRSADGLHGRRRGRGRPPDRRAARASSGWNVCRGAAAWSLRWRWWSPRCSPSRWRGLSRAGAGGRRVDGGDVDLQHRHADQRAATGCARVPMALHTLCALGSFAIGSAFWGALSVMLA